MDDEQQLEYDDVVEKVDAGLFWGTLIVWILFNVIFALKHTMFQEHADYIVEDPGFEEIGATTASATGHKLFNWHADWLGKATFRDFHELPGSFKGQVATGLQSLLAKSRQKIGIVKAKKDKEMMKRIKELAKQVKEADEEDQDELLRTKKLLEEELEASRGQTRQRSGSFDGSGPSADGGGGGLLAMMRAKGLTSGPAPKASGKSVAGTGKGKSKAPLNEVSVAEEEEKILPFPGSAKDQAAQDAEDVAAIDLKDPDVQQAAAKIRAGFLGMMDRKKAKKLKEEKAASAAGSAAANQHAKTSPARALSNASSGVADAEENRDLLAFSNRRDSLLSTGSSVDSSQLQSPRESSSVIPEHFPAFESKLQKHTSVESQGGVIPTPADVDRRNSKSTAAIPGESGTGFRMKSSKTGTIKFKGEVRKRPGSAKLKSRTKHDTTFSPSLLAEEDAATSATTGTSAPEQTSPVDLPAAQKRGSAQTTLGDTSSLLLPRRASLTSVASDSSIGSPGMIPVAAQGSMMINMSSSMEGEEELPV